MAKTLFSVPIFFLVFRETLEAAIIISVLLGLVKQIAGTDTRSNTPTVGSGTALRQVEEVQEDNNGNNTPALPSESDKEDVTATAAVEEDPCADEAIARMRLLKKMRIQIFLGSGIGLFIALSIGAAFLAVWFTQASDLWSKSESLWEGIFSLVASIIIFVIGVTMLKIDRAKLKWRIKLQQAFSGEHVDRRTKAGRWVLFILPFITVLREGLEAVVFVGGVSLGQPATSIPIAAIVGIICGLIIGYIIYTFASRSALVMFMVIMTNLILLIGSGLFSKAIGDIQDYRFNQLLGASVDDFSGDGPGTYDVRGNVWHLNCCNPSHTLDGNGWLIFAAIFGWSNSASLGTVLGYVFYWVAVMVVIIAAKWKEGRVKIFGFESAAAIKRHKAPQPSVVSS